jgi:hypothetical protein
LAAAKSTSPTRRWPDFFEESVRVKIDVGQGQTSRKEGRMKGKKSTLNEVGSDVDNDATLLEPLGLDKVSLADSGDDDVSVLELYRPKARKQKKASVLKLAQDREVRKRFENARQPRCSST